jgi:hypothetical protein
MFGISVAHFFSLSGRSNKCRHHHVVGTKFTIVI